MTSVHFRVDRPARQRGGGRLLDAARRIGAPLAWQETSSPDHPAIAAARRPGFEICGFDTVPGRARGGRFDPSEETS